MPINKNDIHAREHWGRAYDATPKSVFATLAWHLANRASGYAGEPGAAEATAHDEIRALLKSGILPDGQASRAMKALVDAAEPDLSAFMTAHPEEFED